jgi:hypothetical protein
MIESREVGETGPWDEDRLYSRRNETLVIGGDQEEERVDRLEKLPA